MSKVSHLESVELYVKEALNELSSVKLITEILNAEIKILKQTSHIDSNAGNSSSIAKSRNSRGLTNVRPTKEVHTTHVIPEANWYAVLLNHHETQELNDRIFFSNSEQPSRFMTVNYHKYIKGLRRRKTPSVNQPRLPMNHKLNKPNLQEPRKNEDGTYSIPTIVNGVTNVNLNTKFEQKYDSIGNLINKEKSFNVCNKNKYSLSKTTE